MQTNKMVMENSMDLVGGIKRERKVVRNVTVPSESNSRKKLYEKIRKYQEPWLLWYI